MLICRVYPPGGPMASKYKDAPLLKDPRFVFPILGIIILLGFLILSAVYHKQPSQLQKTENKLQEKLEDSLELTELLIKLRKEENKPAGYLSELETKIKSFLERR